ncbi:MAG: glycosyltransferase family 10 [Verrucomicrobiota bacterium]
MRKTIRVNTYYLADWMRRYYFELLGEQFEFIEDLSNPEYVLIGANQTNYLRGDEYIANRFLLDVPDSTIRIYLQHEAVGFDTTLYDYAVLFSDDLKLDDRVFFANFFSAGYFQPLGNDLFERLNKPKADPRLLLSEKTAFCNFVYSHGGVPEREELFRTLSKHRFVESHGKLLNNINPEEKASAETHFRGNWFEEGIDIKSKSKFSIASENALHPKGYYLSEKIVTAMLANTIPIYWGNPEAGRIFNSRAFINCHDYASFDELLERVIEIDRNDELWCEIMSEPWMTPEQYRDAASNQDRLKQFLVNIFSQPLPAARRRPRGFWAGRFENTTKKLLVDAANYRRQQQINIPALQKKYMGRLAGNPGVAQIELVSSELRLLRKRMKDEQWQKFLNLEANPSARLMELMVASEKQSAAKVKLAIAFYDGGQKWGIESNRALGVRLLRELVEGGILESPRCPSKAYLYWGMANMTGIVPVLARNPEVALACFTKINDRAPEKVRNLAIHHKIVILLQENQFELAGQAFTELVLSQSLKKSQVPLLVDLLGQRAELSKSQRELACSILKNKGTKDVMNWKKLTSRKFPWRFRWSAWKFLKNLQAQGCFTSNSR